jgi:hypothetical protein
MIYKKILKSFIIFSVAALMFSGCKANTEEKSPESSFDVKVATNLIENYMTYLMKGDKETARGLYTDELQKSSASLGNEELSVSSYKVDEVNEVGKSAVFRIKVTRNSSKVPFSELDDYTVKVITQGEGYKISEVTSSSEREVFGEGGTLRVRSKTNIKTNLLVDSGGIPGYAFSKNDKASISKLQVPKEGFGLLCLSYGGDSVAISTTGTDSFAGIIKIDESMSVQGGQDKGGGGGGAGGGGQGAGGAGGSNQPSREMPIGKELTTLDLLNGSKIDLMTFSPNEKFIVIQYTKTGFGKNLRLYRVDSGDLAPFVFEDNFPIDKVNIVFSSFNKETLNFEITSKKAGDTSVADYVGKWQVDMKEFKAKKM